MEPDQQSPSFITIGPSILLALERFTEAWRSRKSPPDLNNFLPNQPNQKWLTLVELIKLDLEYRYQVFNFPKCLDEYIERIFGWKYGLYVTGTDGSLSPGI